MLEQTLEDITGTAAVAPLSSVQILAKTLSIRALSTNVGLVRFGDSNISATRGGFLAAGEAYDFDPISDELSVRYDLSQIKQFAAITDKISVVYGG